MSSSSATSRNRGSGRPLLEVLHDHTLPVRAASQLASGAAAAADGSTAAASSSCDEDSLFLLRDLLVSGHESKIRVEARILDVDGNVENLGMRTPKELYEIWTAAAGTKAHGAEGGVEACSFRAETDAGHAHLPDGDRFGRTLLYSRPTATDAVPDSSTAVAGRRGTTAAAQPFEKPERLCTTRKTSPAAEDESSASSELSDTREPSDVGLPSVLSVSTNSLTVVSDAHSPAAGAAIKVQCPAPPAAHSPLTSQLVRPEQEQEEGQVDVVNDRSRESPELNRHLHHEQEGNVTGAGQQHSIVETSAHSHTTAGRCTFSVAALPSAPGVFSRQTTTDIHISGISTSDAKGHLPAPSSSSSRSSSSSASASPNITRRPSSSFCARSKKGCMLWRDLRYLLDCEEHFALRFNAEHSQPFLIVCTGWTRCIVEEKRALFITRRLHKGSISTSARTSSDQGHDPGDRGPQERATRTAGTMDLMNLELRPAGRLTAVGVTDPAGFDGTTLGPHPAQPRDSSVGNRDRLFDSSRQDLFLKEVRVFLCKSSSRTSSTSRDSIEGVAKVDDAIEARPTPSSSSFLHFLLEALLCATLKLERTDFENLRDALRASLADIVNDANEDSILRLFPLKTSISDFRERLQQVRSSLSKFLTEAGHNLNFGKSLHSTTHQQQQAALLERNFDAGGCSSSTTSSSFVASARASRTRGRQSNVLISSNAPTPLLAAPPPHYHYNNFGGGVPQRPSRTALLTVPLPTGELPNSARGSRASAFRDADSVDRLVHPLHDEDQHHDDVVLQQGPSELNPTTSSSTPEDTHDNLARYYFLAFSELTQDLEQHCSFKIDQVENFLNASMDARRNQLLKMEVSLDVVALVFGFGALVSGVFGMNLKSGFEDLDGMFVLVIGMIVFIMLGPVVSICIMLVCGLYYFRNRRGRVLGRIVKKFGASL